MEFDLYAIGGWIGCDNKIDSLLLGCCSLAENRWYSVAKVALPKPVTNDVENLFQSCDNVPPHFRLGKLQPQIYGTGRVVCRVVATSLVQSSEFAGIALVSPRLLSVHNQEVRLRPWISIEKE